MKGLRSAVTLILLLAGCVLLDSLLRLVGGGAAILDPFLLLTVWHAARGRKVRAMGVGAVCGLLQDGVGSVVFGVHFLSKVVVGYVVSLASGRLIPDQPATHAALIAGATVLEVAVVAATGFVLGQRLDLRSPGALVASLAVNVVVGWVAFSVAGQARRRDRSARGFR